MLSKYARVTDCCLRASAWGTSGTQAYIGDRHISHLAATASPVKSAPLLSRLVSFAAGIWACIPMSPSSSLPCNCRTFGQPFDAQMRSCGLIWGLRSERGEGLRAGAPASWADHAVICRLLSAIYHPPSAICPLSLQRSSGSLASVSGRCAGPAPPSLALASQAPSFQLTKL